MFIQHKNELQVDQRPQNKTRFNEPSSKQKMQNRVENIDTEVIFLNRTGIKIETS